MGREKFIDFFRLFLSGNIFLICKTASLAAERERAHLNAKGVLGAGGANLLRSYHRFRGGNQYVQRDNLIQA